MASQRQDLQSKNKIGTDGRGRWCETLILVARAGMWHSGKTYTLRTGLMPTDEGDCVRPSSSLKRRAWWHRSKTYRLQRGLMRRVGGWYETLILAATADMAKNNHKTYRLKHGWRRRTRAMV